MVYYADRLREATPEDSELMENIRRDAILSHPRTFWNEAELQQAADWGSANKLSQEFGENYRFYIYDEQAFMAHHDDYLAYLFLRPALHGQGIGSALLALGERQIAADGYQYAYLWTADYAFRFYQTRGYQMLNETTAPFGLDVHKFIKFIAG